MCAREILPHAVEGVLGGCYASERPCPVCRSGQSVRRASGRNLVSFHARRVEPCALLVLGLVGSALGVALCYRVVCCRLPATIVRVVVC